MKACDGFLCVTEIVHVFHSGYFDYRATFEQFLIRITVLNIAGNEA